MKQDVVYTTAWCHKFFINEYKYPQKPTKLSKDKLYCFVLWVWMVIKASPINMPIFPWLVSIKKGEIIINPVPT